MTQWFRMAAASKGAAEISIFDQIGADETGDGVTAKQFDADLKALGSSPKILLRINSPGGDVMQAMAIYSMLQNSKAKITARIEGIAASAASLIAMAADRVEIHSNAFMLIHQPYTAAAGTAEDLTTAAGDLERMTAQYVSIYAKRSGRDPDEILSIMKEDRLMTAEEAVELGLCDAVIDPSSEGVNLKLVPPHLKTAVEAAITQGTPMAALTPAELVDIRHLMARAKAKAEDENDNDDGEAEDGNENDEKPTSAKKAKASKAKADDDNDIDAKADADDGDDTDKDDKPAARKAKAQGAAGALAYASAVTDLCGLADRHDLIKGFLDDATPLADVRKKLVASRANSEERVSNVRSAPTKVKAEEIEKGWAAALAKLPANKAKR